MDKTEARQVLEDFLGELKQKSYAELQAFLSNPACIERRGPSGITYQIEYEAVWDFREGGDLRLIASIDDGGFMSSLLPMTSGFLISSNGQILA
jgi:hypothetical protein